MFINLHLRLRAQSLFQSTFRISKPLHWARWMLGLCVLLSAHCSTSNPVITEQNGINRCDSKENHEAEVCDAIDNDCDGEVDEGVLRTLYADRDGDGFGNKQLSPFETCDPLPGHVEIPEGREEDCNDICPTCYPGAEELCDGKDNNCNGEVDESSNGIDDGPISEACYTDPRGTNGVGLCRAGTKTCEDGELSACTNQVTPIAEICDGQDNDCDGFVDEGLIRGRELSQSCYEGPLGTNQVGICQPGIQVCEDGVFSACRNEVKPEVERCNTVDDDCDGNIDEGVEGCCGQDGVMERDCSSQCGNATQQCVEGVWGQCFSTEDDGQGVQLPEDEVCDGIDNDCDDRVDEEFNQQGEVCVSNRGNGEDIFIGTLNCNENGDVECTCPEGNPENEQPNGCDDDRDGRVDEIPQDLCVFNAGTACEQRGQKKWVARVQNVEGPIQPEDIRWIPQCPFSDVTIHTVGGNCTEPGIDDGVWKCATRPPPPPPEAPHDHGVGVQVEECNYPPEMRRDIEPIVYFGDRVREHPNLVCYPSRYCYFVESCGVLDRNNNLVDEDCDGWYDEEGAVTLGNDQRDCQAMRGTMQCFNREWHCCSNPR